MPAADYENGFLMYRRRRAVSESLAFYGIPLSCFAPIGPGRLFRFLEAAKNRIRAAALPSDCGIPGTVRRKPKEADSGIFHK